LVRVFLLIEANIVVKPNFQWQDKNQRIAKQFI